jgi:hypothetical protein
LSQPHPKVAEAVAGEAALAALPQAVKAIVAAVNLLAFRLAGIGGKEQAAFFGHH